jgi:hypothetical protein
VALISGRTDLSDWEMGNRHPVFLTRRTGALVDGKPM